MKKRVLYLGDTRLREAAGYLAGVMSHYGIPYDYHPSDSSFHESWLTGDTGLVILSDYPAENFTRDQFQCLAADVKEGLSFLMIGGWESFVGSEGGYQKTPAAEILPVAMQDTDDRMNVYGPCLVKQCQPHPVVRELPFEQEPPTIGGFNCFTAKENTNVILSSLQFKAMCQADGVHFEESAEAPLLVLGSYGAGKTAAFATDVAPHWVGPLVDWGDQRVTACAPGANPIEVGCWYAAFLKNLICWLIDNKVS
ncbi:MAG: glutamine amidotransferase [Planctomycetota bacterium]